jgi:hypothetical protein
MRPAQIGEPFVIIVSFQIFEERRIAMAKKPTIVVNRNSVNGRFVTPAYVQRHPRTTETEHRPVPSKKK